MKRSSVVIAVLVVAIIIAITFWASFGASDLWSSFVGAFTDADAPDHRIESQHVGEWKDRLSHSGTDSPEQPKQASSRPRIRAQVMMRTPDGGYIPFVEPPTLDQRIANACAKLSAAAPNGDRSASAIDRIGDELREMLGAWAMDESLDTLLFAGCDFLSGKVAAIFTAASIREPPEAAVDRWCQFGSLYPQLGKPLWAERDRNRWYAQCKELVARASAPPPVAQPSPRRAPLPSSDSSDSESDAGDRKEAKSVCPAFHAVAAKYEAIASGKVSKPDLGDYGRGLATCGPDQEPWEVFATAEGRSGFVRIYVLPYILQMDARTGDPVAYAKVAHAWKFD